MKRLDGILTMQLVPQISYAIDLDRNGQWHVVLLTERYGGEWTWEPRCSCGAEWEHEGSAPEVKWWVPGDRYDCDDDDFHSELLQMTQ